MARLYIGVGEFPTDAGRHGRHRASMASSRLNYGRVSMTGSYYAVTTVAAGRRKVFRDPRNAALLAAELAPDAAGIRFQPLAWTVMPDHLHLLLALDATPLSRCVQVLKSRTSRLINAGATGNAPVWQAGYYDHCLRADEDLLKQARYILENPVRAGIVDRPQDYSFSWSAWGLEP